MLQKHWGWAPCGLALRLLVAAGTSLVWGALAGMGSDGTTFSPKRVSLRALIEERGLG